MFEPLATGTLLSHEMFFIQSVLGQGAFGIVYQAQDTRLQRCVAVKEFFPQGSCIRQGNRIEPVLRQAGDFEGAKAKFLHEANVLAQFRHENIVSVYVVFEENNTAYMVMELLKGRTLAQLVETDGPLPATAAVGYIKQTASAIETVHQSGLLHRDIKPENIVLTEDGRVVVIDFGIAKKVEQVFGADTVRLSNTQSLGTHGFSPLEQYGRSGASGAPTDIYALGATLYFLLTGQVPVAAIDRATGTDLATPHEIRTDVEPWLSDSVMWSMRLKAEDRPSTVTEFISMLEEDHLKGSQTVAHLSSGFSPAAITGIASSPIAIVSALVSTLRGHEAEVQSVAFSQDGTLLLSGSNDRTAILWDVPSAAPLVIVSGHEARVMTVLLDRAGNDMFTGANDGLVRIWNIPSGSLRHAFKPSFMEALLGDQAYIRSLALTSDDQWLAVAASGGGPVRIWDLQSKRIAKKLMGSEPHSEAEAEAVAFSPDDTLLASAAGTGRTGEVKLWRWQEGLLRWRATTMDGHANVLAFSPDGKVLACGTNGNSVHLWDVLTGKSFRSLTGTAPVVAVAFSAHHDWILAGCSDGFVRIWNGRDRGVLQTFKAHSDGLTDVVYSPQRRQIATCSLDGTIKLWTLL